MTPEPASWRCMEMVEARLRAISIANGYRTDLGAAQFIKDRLDATEQPSAYVAIAAPQFVPGTERAGRNSVSDDMDLLIEVGLPFDDYPEPMRELHRARADVVRALVKPLERSEALGVHGQIEIIQCVFTDAPDNSNFILCQVSARAGLTDTYPPAN